MIWPVLWTFGLLLAVARPGLAQPLAAPDASTPPEAPTGPAPSGAAPTGSEGPAPRSGPQELAEVQAAITALQERTGQLRALMAGTLDPAIDGRSVLRFDASEPALSLAEVDLAARVAAVRKGTRGAEVPQLPDAPEGAAGIVLARLSLQQALVDYLRLTPARKRALLSRHRARAAEQQQLRAEVEALRERLSVTTTRAERLEQFLDDRLPTDVGTGGLVVLDLAPPSMAELGWATSATSVKATSTRGSTGGSARGSAKGPRADSPLAREASALQAQILAQGARVAELQQRFVALSPTEQAGLFTRHAARAAQVSRGADAARLEEERLAAQEKARLTETRQARTEAERAAEDTDRAQQEALKNAQEARSEAQRLRAAERARLLGLQAALSRAEAELAERATHIDHRYDEALGFVNRVQELEGRSVLDRRKESDAAALYAELRRKTREYRGELSAALDGLLGEHSFVPEVPDPKQPELLDGGDGQELNTLHQRLRGDRDALVQREEQQRWRRAMKLRDALSVLNESRLATLPMVSAATRGRVTGFGPDGVSQASSEAEHMALMIRYHGQAFPVEFGRLRDRIGSSTLSIVLTLFQIAFVVLGFRWWRRNADAIVGALYRGAHEAVAPNWITRSLAVVFWYLRRVHVPIAWWALCAVVFGALRGIEGLESVGFIWAIVVWGLAGWTSVLMLDAFAARQTGRHSAPDGQPELRLRSLRTVALLIVVNGLVLSLTEQSVGRGTIHAWTASVAALLVLPVLALLVFWWRGHILERVAARSEPGRILRWVQQRSTGWVSNLAAAVGGAYILFEGVARWLARWLGGFEAAERLSAYIFRNQVQKHVASTAPRARRALPDSEVGSLLPGREPPALMEEVELENLERVEKLAASPGSIVVVVGERGMGKTSFLRRLQRRLPAASALLVGCPRTGFDGLMGALGSELGDLAVCDEPRITDALRARGDSVVLLDDVHLLAQPSVGGLAELDRLLQLARASAERTSWVLSVTSHAWSYIARARGTQGLDAVVQLAPWSRADIGALARERAKQSGLSPSFEELVVPRSFDLDEDSSASRLESGFYRMLWDYSAGNPAVALHFWRRSIFRRDDGQLIVTLFDGPTSVDMDNVPPLLPFVLRALAQLEEADATTIAECANLPPTETQDLLRLALRRGYVEDRGGRSAITAHYYRAVTTLLRRQHLLA